MSRASTAGGPSGGLTAVVAALPRELAALRRRLGVERRWRRGACRLWHARLGELPLVLATTGMGAERARHGAEALFEVPGIRRLVVTGVSGGLDPTLQPGALVVARELIEGERRLAPAPDPGLLAAALAAGGVVPVSVVTERTILATPERKAELLRRLAPQGPAAVDLESATFARAAARHGLPYLVLRAISDSAGEALPFDPERCSDGKGGISHARVVASALARPRSFAALWQLRRRVAACSRSLDGWLVRFLTWTPPGA